VRLLPVIWANSSSFWRVDRLSAKLCRWRGSPLLALGLLVTNCLKAANKISLVIASRLLFKLTQWPAASLCHFMQINAHVLNIKSANFLFNYLYQWHKGA
jgi:hypothetical protein